ncbi:MAG: SURF1 family protein [Betaproteobacteria bacterium]|nr:SURF1 family protein [Betaproteobacteria bacterium]NBY13314.1 SURF1 family protein [Betaproteobacteria bacterium]NDF03541.1 SURF1 family protein [Betaproteobacteria bacterium]
MVSGNAPQRGRAPLQWTAASAVMVALALLTASLGVWQWSRSLEKQTLLNHVRAQQESFKATQPLLGVRPRLAEVSQPATLDRLPVTIRGRWIPNTTLYLDNRTVDARTGVQVLTALALPDGSVAWVNRGFAPKQPGLSDPQREGLLSGEVFLPTSKGEVDLTVVGLTDLFQRLELSRDEAALMQGALWQNLHWDLLKARLREKTMREQPVWPLIFWQTQDLDEPLIQRIPEPKTEDVSKHRGYAVQWWLMALVALWFARRLAQSHARPYESE